MIQFQRKIVRSLASGDILSIPIYTVKGKDPKAPGAYLQSAVHGSEVQGSYVIALLLDHFKKHAPLGEVRLVPNANPMGLNSKRGQYTDGRYDSSSGENWNRSYFLATQNDFPWEKFSDKEIFRAELQARLQKEKTKSKSFSQKLCLTLQELSFPYETCLDLHCASYSIPHLYAPKYAKESARYLGIKHQILMNPRFGGAMDEVFFTPWWSFQEKHGGKISVESYTLELGSHEMIDPKLARESVEGILNYLRHRGVVRGKAKKMQTLYCEYDKYHTVRAPSGGLVEFLSPLGKRVQKGAVLARILSFGKNPVFQEVRAPKSGVPIARHASSVVHEGAELIKMFV